MLPSPFAPSLPQSDPLIVSPDIHRGGPASQGSGSPTPSVCVLLATHNGGRWIDEQIQSIVQQARVRVSIVASDDRSTDDTLLKLANWQTRTGLSLLPQQPAGFGNAHRNFLRLVRDANLGSADYVALADQDDIWLPEKLARAIERLQASGAQAYSSNVTAFWPDGRKRLVKKSQAQRPYDHLFGSPGPGCTFVLPRLAFEALRTWVTQHFDQLQSVWVHDWLIYAFVRSKGLRWHIDEQPTMLYRQHGLNEIGANTGWRAAMSRLRRVRSGAYRRDILAIADLLGQSADVVEAVRRLALRDRLRLLLNVRNCRRRFSESLVLGLFFLVMPRA
jgi:rhamnosyltransferase